MELYGQSVLSFARIPVYHRNDYVTTGNFILRYFLRLGAVNLYCATIPAIANTAVGMTSAHVAPAGKILIDSNICW